MELCKCRKCGYVRFDNKKYCRKCGYDKIIYKFCNHCYDSNLVWDHKDFCEKCGRDRKTALNTFPAKTFRWGRRKIRIKKIFS